MSAQLKLVGFAEALVQDLVAGGQLPRDLPMEIVRSEAILSIAQAILIEDYDTTRKLLAKAYGCYR